MKSFRYFIAFIACSIASVACVSVQAQVTPYVTPTQAAANGLLAMTQPDYYTRRFVTSLAAGVDPCEISICQPRNPMPVTLITFTGQRVDASTVDLFWETSEEVNNDHFVIERTLNPAKGFEPVAKVKGAGSTRSTVRYQARDLNAFDVYTYYRLKQVDTDSTFEYSSIIAIKGNDAFFNVTAFPNPGRYQDLTFRVTGLRNAETLKITVYDTQGRAVYENPDYRIASEQQTVKAILPDLVPGKYSIKISNKNREAVTSFVVIP